MKNRFPCTHSKACIILWLHHVVCLSQTEIALIVRLNVGTVNHVVHRRRFPSAFPQAPG